MSNGKVRVDQNPSEQDILNRSFDPEGETLVVQLMGLLVGGGGDFQRPSVVESTDQPGVFGFVFLNPDGSAIGAGGGTPLTYRRKTSSGSFRVTSNGDVRVIAP